MPAIPKAQPTEPYSFAQVVIFVAVIALVGLGVVRYQGRIKREVHKSMA